MVPNSFRFVNRMLNICYMTGVVRHDEQDKRRFYLSQNANPNHDVPVLLNSPDFVLPGAGQMRTVVAHVRGRVGDYGQTAIAEAISVGQSSILNVNPMSTYLAGFAKRLPRAKVPESSPYTSNGQLKAEFLDLIKDIEGLRPEERAVIDLYEQQYGKVRKGFDSNSNVVIMAGVVDKFNYVAANAHQRHSQGIIHLRQHRSLDEIVPVRVVSNKANVILDRLKPGATIALKGRLRRKIVPTPDGEGILSDLVLVETDMITAADQQQILVTPPWFTDYLRRERGVTAPAAASAIGGDLDEDEDGDEDLDREDKDEAGTPGEPSAN